MPDTSKGKRMPGRLLIAVIRGYQVVISPVLGNCCRFHPCCSAYWIEAIRRHGCLKGCWLGVRRILKCHPFHSGGVDLVPPGIRTAGNGSRLENCKREL